MRNRRLPTWPVLVGVALSQLALLFALLHWDRAVVGCAVLVLMGTEIALVRRMIGR